MPKALGKFRLGDLGGDKVSPVAQGLRSPMNGFEVTQNQVVPPILGKVYGSMSGGGSSLTRVKMSGNNGRGGMRPREKD